MKKIKLFCITFLLCFPPVALSLPAFPGAEGFGSDTIGGRGGAVIHVTNLNDSGSGSFREAVTTPEPRIVVFDVSGYIELQSQLQIKEPFLTIAGQTSPGGICIVGEQTTLRTHDIIIRHMRFRLGQANAADDVNDPNEADSFDIWGNGHHNYAKDDAFNIIIDHCSFSWGTDETTTFTYGPHEVTIQWSMVYEGLKTDRNHSKGLALSNKLADAGLPGVNNITGHHNFLASSTERNPYIAGQNPDAGIIDWRNNVTYNYHGGYGIMLQSDAHVNLIHNFVKAGPESNSPTGSWPIAKIGSSDISEPPMIYVEGNLGNQRTSQNMPEWCVGDNWHSSLYTNAYRLIEPYPVAAVSTQKMDWDYAGTGESLLSTCILTGVGATAPFRDSADSAIINDFHNGTGSIPTWKAYPTDYPILTTPTTPTDTDHDGMPDSWEVSKGLNPNSVDSTTDRNGDGYTNIEEYINELSDNSYTFNDNCMTRAAISEAPDIILMQLR